MIKETDILFLDGTFKCSPKSFYQIFNIVRHLKNKNISLPILSVIMKNKYQISYINLFENFKLILKEHNISIDNNKIYLMLDYESALRNALKICFPNCIILGCYFHYLQCIVKKIKELGLLKKHIVLKVYKFERFNLYSNNIVEHSHPKLSFFFEKYKIILKEALINI